MIQIQEFKSKMTMSGSLPVTLKTAADEFIEWQMTNPDIEVITVQKTENGLFVSYKKKEVETRTTEKAFYKKK